jgi:amino-acid N-acetyltransferase
MRVRTAERSDQPPALALLAAAGLPGDGLDHAWAESAGRICGAVAVERYEAADAPGGAVFLLRSLVVAPELRGGGLGRRLVEAALAETDALADVGKPAVVGLLTDTADGYFERFGFTGVSREGLPSQLAASPELTGVCPASARAYLRGPCARPLLRRARDCPAGSIGAAWPTRPC